MKGKGRKQTASPRKTDLIPSIKCYKGVLGLDDIPDLSDCPKAYEHGKQFLPDWALRSDDLPGEMKKFLGWYMSACKLGVGEVSAVIPGEVFRTLSKTTFADLLEFQNMFCLGWVDITAGTLLCL